MNAGFCCKVILRSILRIAFNKNFRQWFELQHFIMFQVAPIHVVGVVVEVNQDGACEFYIFEHPPCSIQRKLPNDLRTLLIKIKLVKRQHSAFLSLLPELKSIWAVTVVSSANKFTLILFALVQRPLSSSPLHLLNRLDHAHNVKLKRSRYIWRSVNFDL